MSVEACVPAGEAALLRLLQHLASCHYRFITPTPLTHQRVLERRAQRLLTAPSSLSNQPTDVRDVLGWSLPFDASSLDPLLRGLLTDAKAMTAYAPRAPCRALLRVASLGDDLFVHSAFPTVQADAVFFGPDTYRFARFITHSIHTIHAIRAIHASQAIHAQPTNAPLRILDIGCGTGAGGVAAVRASRRPAELTLNDINPKALAYAAANVAAAGITCQWLPGDAMVVVTGDYDVIIANPPYLDDAEQRAYRHGGDRLGLSLSLRMAATALAHLAPGGQLLLYTGVAITGGHDPFLAELKVLMRGFDGTWHYSEIDADVFGEELEREVYADIDRIAAVGLVVTRRGAV